VGDWDGGIAARRADQYEWFTIAGGNPMTLRFGLSAVLALGLIAGSALAQQIVPQGGGSPRPAGNPDQPVAARLPTLERREPQTQLPNAQSPNAQPPLAQQTSPAPFQLTPEEEQQVDRVLQAWEKRSAAVKTFECNFTRFTYNLVFGQPDQPIVDTGVIRYGSPDKGLYQVDGERAEQWICDGKSIFEYNYPKKQLIERTLPPELQGRAIANGPLPFLFGAQAQQLKQRYWIRIITPPANRAQETWLEVYPRFQQQAADFSKADLILTNQNMVPAALQLHSLNGKDRTAFAFEKIVINDPMGWLKSDPFRASKPLGWEKIVEQTPVAQTNRVTPPAKR
jgi:TIGR03009 family protein